MEADGFGPKDRRTQKGTPNKRTSVLAAKAEAAVAGAPGEMPIRIMRDPTTEPH
jgi:hypothetical protein